MLPTEIGDSVGIRHDKAASSGTSAPSTTAERPNPPVKEGEIRTVTIDTLGDQGDGITRIERGFVVIVADTEPDEEVTDEIDTVQSNVAFASIIEREE